MLGSCVVAALDLIIDCRGQVVPGILNVNISQNIFLKHSTITNSHLWNALIEHMKIYCKCMEILKFGLHDLYCRGVGTGPAGPATIRPMSPEPTKNIIPLFVIKQIIVMIIESS